MRRRRQACLFTSHAEPAAAYLLLRRAATTPRLSQPLLRVPASKQHTPLRRMPMNIEAIVFQLIVCYERQEYDRGFTPMTDFTRLSRRRRIYFDAAQISRMVTPDFTHIFPDFCAIVCRTSFAFMLLSISLDFAFFDSPLRCRYSDIRWLSLFRCPRFLTPCAVCDDASRALFTLLTAPDAARLFVTLPDRRRFASDTKCIIIRHCDLPRFV